MERYLLVSGRIISFIFVPVSAALLALVLAAILLVNAGSMLPVLGQNLIHNHVLDDLPPAIWEIFIDTIPPDVQVGRATIPTAPLATALRRSARDIIDNGLPLGEWLQTRAQIFVAAMTGNLRGRVTGAMAGPVNSVQSALSGPAAAPLANIILSSLDACTDVQISEISRVLSISPSAPLTVGISFLCRPPESLGVGAADLMRNTIVLALSEVALRMAGALETRLTAIKLPPLTVDSPVGRLTLEWPNVRIGSGFLSVTVPLPDSIVDPINEAVSNFFGPIVTPVRQAATQAVEARSTVSVAATQISSGIATRMPSTVEPTPVPSATPTAPTLVPTLTPDELQAERDAISPLEQRVLNVLDRAGDALNGVAGRVITCIFLLLGLPLLLHSYLQLYLMRVLRLWGLWIALVAVFGGAALLYINNAVVSYFTNLLTPLEASTLAAPLAAIWSSTLATTQQALQSQVYSPFTTVALLLILPGLAGIVFVALHYWRERRLINAAGV